MATKNYFELPGLDGIYLEDSFLLDIRQVRNTIEILLDVVLREIHGSYESPRAGEQYCYRRGRLVFHDVIRASWASLSFDGALDGNEETDFGNIDEFVFRDGRYLLSGEWGQLEIWSNTPEIELDPR